MKFLLPLIAFALFPPPLLAQSKPALAHADSLRLEAIPTDQLRDSLDGLQSHQPALIYAYADRARQRFAAAKRLADLYETELIVARVSVPLPGVYFKDIIGNLRAATRIARQLGDSMRVAYSLRRQARVLFYLEQRSAGEQQLFAALRIYEELQDSTHIYALYPTLCEFAVAGEDYTEGLRYAQLALRHFRRTGNDREAHFVGFCRLSIYAARQQDSLLVELAEDMLAYERFTGGGNNRGLLTELIAAYARSGRTGLQRKRLVERVDFDARQTVVRKDSGDYFMSLGELFLFDGDYPGVIATLQPFLARPNERISIHNYGTYQHLLTALRRTGRWREATILQDTLRAFDARQHAAALTAQRNELRIQYATAQRETLIENQRTEISTGRQRQFYLTGLALTLVLGATGLLWGLRNNHRKNAQLALQNQRNELLLKEIHHRVKNNLETVSSLLELQSATLEDGHAQAAMRAGQSRVQSMGLLHQKLYQGQNLSGIDIADYLRKLADSLLETYGAEERITVTVVAEPGEVDVDTAVPLGLITNELLTNSIKYAYPEDGLGGDAGAVRVTWTSDPTGRYRLTVRDYGVGNLPGQPARGTGFGSRLIQLLVRQLGATLRETSPPGGGWLTEVDC